MKLSQAILEGAQKVGQGFGAYIQVQHNQVKCCALGMVRVSIGYYVVYTGDTGYFHNNNDIGYTPLENTFPILNTRINSIESLRERIVFWNDTLRLPPHEIAMRVASIECKVERGESVWEGLKEA